MFVGNDVAFTRRDIHRDLSQNPESLRRPAWMTSQRCSATTCVPCDRAVAEPTQDGCLVSTPVSDDRKNPDHWNRMWSRYNQYRFNTSANTDMISTSLTIKLKCLDHERVQLSTHLTANNTVFDLYFNGRLKWTTRSTLHPNV